MANLAFTYPSKIRQRTVERRANKPHSATRIAGLQRLWRRVCMVIAKWDSRALQRERLAQLNYHLLADVGLTREKPIVEVSKLFCWLP